ncbi:MAG: hypothetical protein ACOYKQ_13315 [Polymorphobacter sp.]
MNPYDPNMANLLIRLKAWVHGLFRRYRRPLLAVAVVAAALGIGVSTDQTAPPEPTGRIASR